MRIKEIHIDRYGPLNQIYLPINPGLQAIYGDNESGKTLLVDAVIKQLTGNMVSDSSLNRVTERPEGYIILEDQGNEYKVDRDNDLSSYLPLEPYEIRNIFVIRNSDLEIPEPGTFYERTYQRLTGLRTDEIRSIIDRIKNMGRLTKTSLEIADSKPHNKAASNLKNAQRLQKKINAYLKETSQEGVDKTESILYQDKLRKDEIVDVLKSLDEAKKKEDFVNLDNSIDELTQIYADSKELPTNEDILKINLKIEDYLRNETEIPKFKKTSSVAKFTFSAFLVVTLISWAIVLFRNASDIGYSIPLVLLACSAFSGYIWFNNNKKSSQIDVKKNEIIRLSKKLGIPQEFIVEIQNHLDELKEKIEKTNESIQQSIGVFKKALGISENETDIVLQKARQSLNVQKSEIDFGIELEYNEKMYGDYQDEILGLDENIESNKEKLSGHTTKLSEFSDAANNLEFNAFIGRPLNVVVSSLESLRLLRAELSDLIDKIKSDASCAVCAAEIFQELQKEETDKIDDLFAEDNETSRLFSMMTKGRYSKVFYDNSEEKIIVERPSGQQLEATKLSKGAYDQLYLAIRIDLAQRITEGKMYDGVVTTVSDFGC